jgi:BMFP domain-containing protein YqiC
MYAKWVKKARIGYEKEAKIGPNQMEGSMDPKMIDDIARRLSEAVPEGIRHLQEDLEQNFRAVLQSALAKMDLVTREEFDVQAAVLRRTREKLEELDKKLAQLEGDKD